jgi:hypothetical protein
VTVTTQQSPNLGKSEETISGQEKWQIAKYSVIDMLCSDSFTCLPIVSLLNVA